MLGKECHQQSLNRVFDLLGGPRGETKLQVLCNGLDYDYRKISPLSHCAWPDATTRKLAEKLSLLTTRYHCDDFEVIYACLDLEAFPSNYKCFASQRLSRDHHSAFSVLIEALDEEGDYGDWR